MDKNIKRYVDFISKFQNLAREFKTDTSLTSEDKVQIIEWFLMGLHNSLADMIDYSDEINLFVGVGKRTIGLSFDYIEKLNPEYAAKHFPNLQKGERYEEA